MKYDIRLIAGIFIGMVVGLHYHAVLMTYMPLLVIAAMVLLLRIVHR